MSRLTLPGAGWSRASLASEAASGRFSRLEIDSAEYPAATEAHYIDLESDRSSEFHHAGSADAIGGEGS
ncbi:MAG: hypothetical protein JWN27_2541 [Candidatus Eremiobacteraeota bacterium]|nr:hypothetical protein [Candidatus Eremiobacteraeota bacterium]